MTDKDKNLLELAARAAGFEAGWVIQGWNPLIDNGAALWLVVKLGLTLVVESDMVFCRNQRSDKAFCERGRDRYAATRRAIVRAAADIGKAMTK